MSRRLGDCGCPPFNHLPTCELHHTGFGEYGEPGEGNGSEVHGGGLDNDKSAEEDVLMPMEEEFIGSDSHKRNHLLEENSLDVSMARDPRADEEEEDIEHHVELELEEEDEDDQDLAEVLQQRAALEEEEEMLAEMREEEEADELAG